MIKLIKIVLIIIGLSVVVKFISRLLSYSSTKSIDSKSSSAKASSRKKDDKWNDGEYVEYEEIN